MTSHSSQRNKSCEDRIDDQLKGRIEELDQFNQLSDDYEEKPTKKDQKIIDELGLPHEYALELTKLQYDYQDELTKWRYGLSWGGPADGFYLFADKAGLLQAADYYFQDWFDGAEREMYNANFETVRQFVERFVYLEDA